MERCDRMGVWNARIGGSKGSTTSTERRNEQRTSPYSIKVPAHGFITSRVPAYGLSHCTCARDMRHGHCTVSVTTKRLSRTTSRDRWELEPPGRASIGCESESLAAAGLSLAFISDSDLCCLCDGNDLTECGRGLPVARVRTVGAQEAFVVAVVCQAVTQHRNFERETDSPRM